MKSKMTAIMVLTTLLGIAANALAATGSREDNSMFLVWAFLGMCALIVIVQLMPVVFMTVGMVKGILKGGKQSEAKAQAISEE